MQAPEPADASVKADVIVDTWNVRGHIERVLGDRRYPTPDGVRRALRAYGFEVAHNYTALAVDPGSHTAQVKSMLGKSKSFAQIVETHSNVTLLRGRLVERDGRVEEKLVDVLCALQVLRSAINIAIGRSLARAIVVLSEDIDLCPSYAMAEEFGIPVYAASSATVHTRANRWLILGDYAFEAMAEVDPKRDYGQARRYQLGLHLTSPTTPRNYQVAYRHSGSGLLHVRHRTGVGGVVDPTGLPSASPGDRLSLYSAGVDIGRNRTDYPRVLLSAAAGSSVPANVVEGEIVRWADPTRVEVSLPMLGATQLDYTLGAHMPSDKVLVEVRPSVRPQILAPTIAPRRYGRWGYDTSRPQVATVDRDASARGALLPCLVDGVKFTLLPPSDDVPKRGDRYAVVPIQRSDAGVTHVMAVSSVLKQSATVPK